MNFGETVNSHPAGLARPHWRRQLEQRRALRFTGRQLQQCSVEREHEHWRVVRVRLINFADLGAYGLLARFINHSDKSDGFPVPASCPDKIEKAPPFE